MGCFWGAERKFWELGDGIYVTAAGYAGGLTPNPTYEEVCSGATGHNEVVFVAFDPAKISYEALIKTFWESHDPTQGMRQGNDVGTQYRSAIYVENAAQRGAAEASKAAFAKALAARGFAPQSQRRSSIGRIFITPKPITSNISRKIRGAIAASAALAFLAPSGSRRNSCGVRSARAGTDFFRHGVLNVATRGSIKFSL